jgi:hypothetical protein
VAGIIWPSRDDIRGRSTAASALDRRSTTLDRRSTAALERAAMFNRASAARRIWDLAPLGGAVAETVDRGFDWGSAAVGAGMGAASTLLLIGLGAAVRSRGTGSHQGGGSPS